MSGLNFKKRDLLFVLTGLTALFLLSFIIFFSLSQSLVFKNNNKAVIILDFGNGKKVRKFIAPVPDERIKAWSLLQQACSLANILLETKDNFIPKKIDGLSDGDDGKNWHLYINGFQMPLNPFNISIKPGDKVVFKFE